MDWGSRRTRIRAWLAFAGVTAIAASMGSCTIGVKPPSAGESLVQHFAQLLDRRDADGAAALTSYPNAASASIRQLFDGLSPGASDFRLSQFIDLDPEDAFFTMDASWHFGAGKDWSYRMQGKARKLAVGWRISWDPEVLMPGLGRSRSARLVRTYAPPPAVTDIGGGPLMTEQIINTVELDPARTPDRVASAAAVAGAIAPVAPLITGPSLVAEFDAARGRPITAVTLREDDFSILAPRLTGIPGVFVRRQPRLISADRRITSPMLDALREVWQQNRESTAGWAVQLFDPDGTMASQPAGFQGPPGPKITSTLDAKLQLAAEDAVVSVGTAASIVAIQPSSGAVLAVAQNSYASEEGPVAFTGLYPAGGSLDLFAAGTAAGKKLRLQDVSTKELMKTVHRVGIGVDLRIPGLQELTGRVPGSHLIEPIRLTTVGSGAVQVTPFGMAVAAATIARGSLPRPMISLWQPASTDAVPPLRSDVADRLRGLLKESAAKPEFAPILRSFPDVVGYTAAAGAGQWFVGTRGDLAFAVHISDAEGDDAGARMVARMFRSLSAPAQ